MFSECFTTGFKMELDEENESREQSTAGKDILLSLCNSIVTQSGLNMSDGKNTKTLRILAKILIFLCSGKKEICMRCIPLDLSPFCNKSDTGFVK